MTNSELWARFKKYYLTCGEVSLDVSRMNFSDSFLAEMDGPMRKAFEAMDKLEAGAIANPDEKRMVGHYWLRDATRAPSAEITVEIKKCLADLRSFTRAVHNGKVHPQKAKLFKKLLVVGIGGSALGPQFVARALGDLETDVMTPYFFDNTDPNGMDLVLQQIGPDLKETLCIVISKSGGTKETRNGMLEAEHAYTGLGLKFAQHAVAITQDGSALDKVAQEETWLARLPMWDWVGGRTSELSAVGLLPAALQGLYIQGMLDGAHEMDEFTRIKDPLKNPAALLALMWYHASGGRGQRDMVILPYKDRLELFSKYLQQLVMESIGKEKDLDGKVVNQGLTVYGNKGSTDQHAYVQQLREGIPNFFVTFVEVMRDRIGRSMLVEPGATSGDYLSGFYQGTRTALYEKGRESITITVPDVTAEVIGKLIALYERTVGFYASLININAYHQPGVEAGKKAAGVVLDLQQKIVTALKERKGQSFTVEQVAEMVGAKDQIETVFKILQHASANKDHSMKFKAEGNSVFEGKYGT
ncbi:MAG TPA: glucose-6-phosphate isomerase [Planctomycetota bacterium]